MTGLPAPGELTRGEVEDLTDALLEHRVLLARGLFLDAGSHAHLARRFGSVSGAPDVPAKAWVAAGSDDLAPPKILTFRSSPGAVGEVLFADTAQAYRALPHPLRALADRSWALHHGGEDLAGDQTSVPTAHPVTRLHPETGDRILLLGGLARGVLGLDHAESRAVLQLLQGYVARPGQVLRWRCAPGDVVIADGRAVQHRADGAIRNVVRLDVRGEAPLGVNGQHSHVWTTDRRPIRDSA